MTPRSAPVRKPNAGKTAAKARTSRKNLRKTSHKTSGKTLDKTTRGSAADKTGKLPEWNLGDLYAGIDAPEVARDLAKLDVDCAAFETDYRGKLAEHAARDEGGTGLGEGVRRYEAFDVLAARLGSFGVLVHAGDSVDPPIS